MTAIVTEQDGRYTVTCRACRAQAETAFREVARTWARTHTCPITTLRAMRARKGEWV